MQQLNLYHKSTQHRPGHRPRNISLFGGQQMSPFHYKNQRQQTLASSKPPTPGKPILPTDCFLSFFSSSLFKGPKWKISHFSWSLFYGIIGLRSGRLPSSTALAIHRADPHAEHKPLAPPVLHCYPAGLLPPRCRQGSEACLGTRVPTTHQEMKKSSLSGARRWPGGGEGRLGC